MRITIADVAARAGVSKTTVSRVLNGRGELDDDTAARVRAVIDELGYVPSARAVGLARGRTRIVGMLVPSLIWPWMGEVVQGAVDVVESGGYGLLLFTCNQGAQSMRQFAAQVSAKSFDGLLVIEPEGTLDYITQLPGRGLPVVLIDDRGSRRVFPSVATTNRAGGAAAAGHLLELGRTRPLVVTGSRRFGCTRDRMAGFADTYAANGLPLPPELVVEGDFTLECGRRAVQRLLADGVHFDAVFAHNDLSAGGAVRALREAGRSVPDDVAVVGFDDVPYALHTDPPLTTVHQPMREMGEAAARMLIDHFAGMPLPETPQVLPTTLIVRGSTVPGAPPAPATRSGPAGPTTTATPAIPV
ncbi:LacI family DNA-binding transcriptional regulator [Polymorphospora rubra]|uniref:LacI family DNA-binding transcriptional regulator n=1 Tax=Polymorphospora rubra TaxID=338584 RepID=UPI0031DE4B20